jgi:cytochrome c-type biogenesis protein CcmH
MIALYLTLLAISAAALWLLLLPLRNNAALPLNTRRLAACVIAAMFSFGVFSTYALTGAPEIVPMLRKHREETAMLQADILEQSNLIRESPRNLQSWLKLGQSYMGLGRYDSAVNAFRQASILSKGSPPVLLAFAGAMISQAGGLVTDDAKKSLEMIILQQPDHAQARYLLALRMLQDGHNAEAMKSMKDLYRSLPSDSPVKAMIDRQIGRQ